MFVRKKRNRSGTISVVVVSKSHGQFKEVKSFGIAQTESEATGKFYAKILFLTDKHREIQPLFEFSDEGNDRVTH